MSASPPGDPGSRHLLDHLYEFFERRGQRTKRQLLRDILWAVAAIAVFLIVLDAIIEVFDAIVH